MLRATSLTNAAITGGTITGTNVPYVEFNSAIPMIVAGSGSMANNGAVTWTTALPNAYLGGAWVVMAAGSIAAGVPAATSTLWYVGATTTTGTFFNSTYTSGQPTLGTTTAFATTGPGAFAGLATLQTTASLPIPGNTIGPNGFLEVFTDITATNNANAKAYTLTFGANTLANSLSLASQAYVSDYRKLRNRGLTNAQVFEYSDAVFGQGSLHGAGAQYGSNDTTASLTLAWGFIHSGAATDHIVLESFIVRAHFRP